MSETRTLQALMDRAAACSDETQAELVQSMLEIEARHHGAYRLDAAERAAIERGLDDVRHGRFATKRSRRCSTAIADKPVQSPRSMGTQLLGDRQ